MDQCFKASCKGENNTGNYNWKSYTYEILDIVFR